MGIESGEIKLVIDQLIQGMFEGVRQELPFEISGDEARAGVDILVAGHGKFSLMTLDIPFGSPQNTTMNRLSLQLR